MACSIKSLWFLFISVWLKCVRPQNICKTDPALGERIPWRYEGTKCSCMVIYHFCLIHYHCNLIKRQSHIAYTLNDFLMSVWALSGLWPLSLTMHFSLDSSCRLFNTNHAIRPWSCHFHPESDWQWLCVSIVVILAIIMEQPMVRCILTH